MTKGDPSTVGGVIAAAAAYLEGRGVECPRVVAELLMSRLLGCKRLELGMHAGAELDEKRLAAMRRGVKRVASGEPVQYVIGETGFMGHRFRVDRRALIPRPDTEALVEKVLETESLWKDRKPVVGDVGTGTGCIVISLALARPDAYYVGLDVSPDALELARQNAEALGVTGQVAFLEGELADAVEPETLDAIVANLPYIPSNVIETLPVHIRQHEPRRALDGGPDGLTFLRGAVGDATIVLKNGGFLFLEIGEDQGPAVAGLLEEAGFADVEVSRDLGGRDRVVSGRLFACS